jgi:SAM-dependent methyltransferase
VAHDSEFWDALIRRRDDHAFDTYASPAAVAKAREEVDRLLVARLDGAAGSLLEIGCGSGRMTQIFADLFAKVVAVDISREAARRCRQLLYDRCNVLVVVGDHRTVAAMPSASFDVVFSYATLQHVSDRVALRSYVASAVRLFKADGVALVQVRHPGWMSRIVDAGAFVRRVHSHQTWSRSWRGHVLDRPEIAGLVATRPGATLTTHPDAPVRGIPRHMWIEVHDR